MNKCPSPHLGMSPDFQMSGLLSPWCQYTFTAGIACAPSPRGPYSYTAVIDAGAISGWTGALAFIASTVSGAFRFSAQNARSFQWLPRSLIVPLPKSHHLYHLGPGKYTSLKGRSGAGPSQASQFK